MSPRKEYTRYAIFSTEEGSLTSLHGKEHKTISLESTLSHVVPEMRSIQRQEECVLTSYVRALQQRRPAADKEGKETLSFRRTLSISHIKNSFLRKNQHIVGRDHELQLLHDCYDRVVATESTEAVTIYGPSGAGKSSLVEAFFGRLPTGAFHMEGKFNDRQSRAPYAVLAAASDRLCRQIMRRENSAEIRNRIRAVLGPDVSLLGNLVPTLANMTAEDDDDDDIGQRATANIGAHMFTRFKLLFRAFLGCVASAETPVVFFLDDVQWADVASLEVLKTLLNNGQSQCIMIACAYREGEMTTAVLEQYGLSERDKTSLDEMNDSRLGCAGMTHISVDCLDFTSMNQLLSGAIGVDAVVTQSLSTLVWSKTNGNPFHALCFLDMLHQNGMLSKEGAGPGLGTGIKSCEELTWRRIWWRFLCRGCRIFLSRCDPSCKSHPSSGMISLVLPWSP